MLTKLGINRGRYYDWCHRQGQANRPARQTPRSSWLTPTEKAAIVAYHAMHPEVGYRRMTYMMLDEDVVAVSPSSVYRVLTANGCLNRWNR